MRNPFVFVGSTTPAGGRRTVKAALAAIPLITAAVVSSPPAGAVHDTDTQKGPGVSRVAAKTTLRVGDQTRPSVVGSLQRPLSTAGPQRALAATASFKVTYDGFTPAARAAFERAVGIWASSVTSTVPITVKARFAPLGRDVLGSAGPTLIWRDFRNAPQANTFYPDAVANKRAGRQLDPRPDIQAHFSSNFTNWWFGAGAAPAGKFDFTAVVLHELGHGLGFVGAGNVSGGQGTVRLAGDPLAYDRNTETGGGAALLSFPDPSAQLANQLTSNNIFFDSARVRRANGGNRAKLFAPPQWQQGSSYSHLNEATYGPGNRNSLMTPAIGPGETIRTAGPITLAIFRSTGW